MKAMRTELKAALKAAQLRESELEEQLREAKPVIPKKSGESKDGLLTTMLEVGSSCNGRSGT